MTFPEHLKLFNMTFLKMTVLVIYSCGSKDSLEICGCVLVFQVPMVMLSLARIFDDAPVAYLTPPSWCMAEGAVLVDLGGDRSSMVWLLVGKHRQQKTNKQTNKKPQQPGTLQKFLISAIK